MLKAFNNIVKIADARTLWEKIKDDDTQNGSQAVAAATGAGTGASASADKEEVEDAQGNVFTRRAFDELRRQGIV